MNNDEISQIAKHKHVSEDVVRRIVADRERVEKTMRTLAPCTEEQAVMYLIEKEKFVLE